MPCQRTFFTLCIAFTLLLQPLTVSAEVSLTEEKIAGQWCLTHTEIGGEKGIEMIPYEFFPGGKFTFRNSSTASQDREAQYELSGNTLNLKGLHRKLEIQKLDDREMIGKWMATFHFRRGGCSDS